MTHITNPYPPLGCIEERLFGEAAAVDAPSAAEMLPEPAEPAAATVLPGWLSERIRQLASQREVPPPACPAPGQIWSLAYQGERAGQNLNGRIPVLLDRALEDGRWQGWLVSGDSDYAASDDLLLNPREQAVSPLATLVQAWNGVQAAWDEAAPFLGHIDAAALENVRLLACASPTLGVPHAQPGQACWREIKPGRLLLTGQPLGDAHDPRWAYRQLYRQFALACLPELANRNEFDV